jgi:hypothetical protein
MAGAEVTARVVSAAGVRIEEIEPPITTMVFEPLVWTATTVAEGLEPRVIDEPGGIVWPAVTKLDGWAGLGVAGEPLGD